ncbi:MAG: alcohol dehydrogenase catalytic domain-containing protein [Nitrososphaerota archaeon]|nr:alcohol dehydrogenase catalytic domain-containing protein [Nitrososphaerota archaeon]
MKAVLVGEPGEVKVEEVTRPEPAEGEVLVRLRCCGVCGTDLEKVHGQGITSKVLGHEEVGEIAEIGGGVTGLSLGQRVYAHHHVPCGACDLCRRGEQTLCPEYSKHNLVPCGLAEYFIVPKYNVDRGAILALPDGLSFEEASFIEPMACCIRGLERAGARSARTVLIYGAGPVGLLHLRLLRSYGDKKVVISDVSAHRLGLAAKLGADDVFNASDPAEGQRALVALGGGPDLVILATGSAAAFDDAMRTVAKGGTVLLFGAPKKDAKATIDIAHLFLNGTKLVTSYAATEVETRMALDLLAGSRVTVSDMITHRFPLSKSAEAFAVADKQQCMKALIIN